MFLLSSPLFAAEVIAPPDGATDQPVPVTLQVDAEGRFEGRELWLPGPDFTVIALPDTQFYACGCRGGAHETFYAQTAWAAEVADERNVAFVTQLGDCVENGDQDMSEWEVADAAFTTVEEAGLPFGIAVGNHDQTPFGDPDGDTVGYNATFGVERFEHQEWYGGHRGEDNDNHYELFSAGGLDWIIVHVEYDQAADSPLAAWAAEVLDDHADRKAIVVSHYLLNPGGDFSTQGALLDDALSPYDVVVMLAGHLTDEELRTDDHGDHVTYTMLSDYQSLANGGDGWMRILTFSPANDTIAVETWSPTRGEFEEDANSAFTVDRVLDAPWEDLGEGTEVSWSGLAPETTYEWRLVEEDGTISGPWTFTTGAEFGDTSSDSETVQEPPVELEKGCGCAHGAGGFWLLGALVLSARRRRPRPKRGGPGSGRSARAPGPRPAASR